MIKRSNGLLNYQSKIETVNKREQILQLDATQKYERFKKSASLPTYFLNKAKLRKIAQIYHTLSVEKVKSLSHKSNKPSYPQTPQKKNSLNVNPFTPNYNHIIESQMRIDNTQKKLTLQRNSQNKNPVNGQFPNSHLSVQVRQAADRIEAALQIKGDLEFKKEIAKIFERLKSNHELKKEKSIQHFSMMFKVLEDCQNRLIEIRQAEIRKEYNKLQQELSSMQLEVKKKSIKMMLDRKEIQQLQVKNKRLEKEIEVLTQNSIKCDIGINTETEPKQFFKTLPETTNAIFENNQLLELSQDKSLTTNLKMGCDCWKQIEKRNIKIAEMMKKHQQYSKQARELLGVMTVLKKEGIDVERVYEQIVNGRVEIDDISNDEMQMHTKQIQNQIRKIYHKHQNVKQCNSFDADESIISSADGLSIDFEGQTIEDFAYTIRQEYKCKKELPAGLKQKLKLNFDVLYENHYIQEYDSDESEEDPPTV